MIPVFQDRFGGEDPITGDWTNGGNCAWACVASVLEIDFNLVRDLMPATDTDLIEWSKANVPDLKCHSVDLCYDFETVPGPGIPTWEGPHAWDRWDYKVREDWTPPKTDLGAWIATIYSPGLQRTARDPYYPFRNLHAVVFSGRELVHDPNPAYPCPREAPKVLGMTWWTRG